MNQAHMHTACDRVHMHKHMQNEVNRVLTVDLKHLCQWVQDIKVSSRSSSGACALWILSTKNVKLFTACQWSKGHSNPSWCMHELV